MGEEHDGGGAREAIERCERLLAGYSRSARAAALFAVRLAEAPGLGDEVLHASPSFRDIVGVEQASDFRGWLRALCAEDRVEALALGAALRAGLEELDRVFRAYHRGRAEWRHLRVVATVVEREAAGAVVLAGVVSDVTEAERALVERRELEERFRRARELEALGTLAAGVAHDFNNLLMSVQGHISLALAEAGAGSPVAERLRAIEEQVRSGTDLTVQLLGLARSGGQEARPTDLARLVRRTGAAFARTRKRVTVDFQIPAGPCVATVDPHKVELALLNLLVNAADAMPEGGTVVLAASPVDPDPEAPADSAAGAPRVELLVRDEGVGMDPETLGRIFDPFFTTKPRGEGTGLGLSAVRSIVLAHGGSVDVESAPGAGSTFRILLPASELPVEVEDATEEDGGGACTGTVLVVDDEPGNLRVVSEMLKLLGYEPLTASSGLEAVHLYELRGADVAVVLLDLVMPGIGGLETFRRLRTLDPAARVVFTTGFAQDGALADLVRRGEASFVVKPFTLNDLAREVRAAIEPGQAPRPGRR